MRGGGGANEIPAMPQAREGGERPVAPPPPRSPSDPKEKAKGHTIGRSPPYRSLPLSFKQ